MLSIGLQMVKARTLPPMSRRPSAQTDFGKRLREARDIAGLTQEQAAKGIGISQSTLSELENLHSGSSHVVAFAKLYGVDPFWLALGDGTPHGVTGLDADAVAFAQTYQALRPHERQKLRMLLHVARDGVNPANISAAPKTGVDEPDAPDSGLGRLQDLPARKTKR